MRFFIALSLFVVYGLCSFLNIRDPTTGDFAGPPLPNRDLYSTYINTDSNGNVVSYGFQIPKFSLSGLDSLDPSIIILGGIFDFNTTGLAHPEQIPFKFVELNYNPYGHDGQYWGVPHFDIHFWFEAAEFSLGIDCVTFPPCTLTPFLQERFDNLPPSDYYPAGYVPLGPVPTMGQHLFYPDGQHPNFTVIPATIYGAYNGQLIFYEPMVAVTILKSTESGAKLSWPWPTAEKVPKPGFYPSQFTVSYDKTHKVYKIEFNKLFKGVEYAAGVKVYQGATQRPSGGVQITVASASKPNCFIAQSAGIWTGVETQIADDTFCCAGRGTVNNNKCDIYGNNYVNYYFVGSNCYTACAADY